MSDARALLKRIVMSWDADQDEEFIEAVSEARALLGFVLDAASDEILTTLQSDQHDEDNDEDDDWEGR